MTKQLPKDISSFRPVYLVELFDLATGELLDADVTGSMSNAVQSAIHHIKLDPTAIVTGVDVQLQEGCPQGGIEGIAFFCGDSADQMVVCVSRYELNHEAPQCPELAALDSAPTSVSEYKSLLAQALNA